MKNAPLEATRWLRQARLELAAVRTLRAAGHHALACFHSQQVAEKALKAVLYGRGERIVIGHSVQDLAARSAVHDAAFAALAADAAFLDQFYIPTRYPNGLPAPAVPAESYTDTQAGTAEEAAERVLRAAESHLGT